MMNLSSFYSFFSRLSKREKAVFYWASAIISIMLIDRIIVAPIHSKVTSLNDEARDKIAGIKRNMHILAQENRITAQTKEYASYLKVLESSDEDVTSLLKEVERMANEASVYLIDIKPSGIEEAQGYSKLLVRLNCEAVMERIASFMYIIESSDQLLKVENYKINPAGRKGEMARCSMTVSRRIKKDDLKKEVT